jgi:hypothetical protein
VVDATVKRNASHRVKTLKVTSLSRGTQLTAGIGGATARSALGLRSTWFGVGVLSLQPPSPNPVVAAGTRIRLTGIVRGVQDVVVQRRTGATAWTQFRSVVPAAQTGAFQFTVRPKLTTQYRLATTKDAAASVRIRVQAATVK